MRIEIEREPEGEFPAGWEFSLTWDSGKGGTQLYVTDKLAAEWGFDTSRPETVLVGVLKRGLESKV